MFKKLILPLLLIGSVLSARAQETGNDPAQSLPEDKVYEMFDIQTPPSFPGTEKAMMKFLGENISYPAAARKNSISGTVVVKFVVRKDGTITDIKLDRSIGGGCDEEALRVVRLMPKWTPGQLDGKPVNVVFTLPVRFRLG